MRSGREDKAGEWGGAVASINSRSLSLFFILPLFGCFSLGLSLEAPHGQRRLPRATTADSPWQLSPRQIWQEGRWRVPYNATLLLSFSPNGSPPLRCGGARPSPSWSCVASSPPQATTTVGVVGLTFWRLGGWIHDSDGGMCLCLQFSLFL